MVYTISRRSALDKNGYSRPRGLAKVDFNYVRKLPEKPKAEKPLPDDVVQAGVPNIVLEKEAASFPSVDEIIAESEKGRSFGTKKTNHVREQAEKVDRQGDQEAGGVARPAGSPGGETDSGGKAQDGRKGWWKIGKKG